MPLRGRNQMAAGYLPPPGSEHGPCDSCEHRDCAETRRMAAAKCMFCHEPIGYVYGFYQHAWVDFEHAVCAQRFSREDRDGEPHDLADYGRRIREGTRERSVVA